MMKNKKSFSARRWTIVTLCISLGMLLAMSSFVYFYDPFCYYRIPRDRLIVNNYRFLNAGLTKNADYDTAIIGSSMTQNFHMDLFREELNMNPVKLSIGGMSLEGTELTYKQLMEVGRVENLVFCIDLPALNKNEDKLETYATYLYNEDRLDDFQYLLGYETWLRLLPLNIGLNAMEQMGKTIPSSYGTHSVDSIGEWDTDAKYGEELVRSNYIKNGNQVSEQKLENIVPKMKANADRLLNTIFSELDEQVVVLFFPPYSALYWHDAKKAGYFEAFQEVKKYIVMQMADKENVRIYDFQAMKAILDLNNYKDITHYRAEINDLMVEMMAKDEYRINIHNMSDYVASLESDIVQFEKENESWLKE